jgi:antitoxin component YwqK of YwqJK toxin-antitoxin module
MLLASGFFLHAQDINQKDANGLKQGYWIKKDDNGKKVYEGKFLNDKPQGLFKYYYPGLDSVKTQMVFYKEGSIAYAKMFHVNGKLMARGKYVKEQKDSVWSFYDEEGLLISVDSYKSGKKDGASKVYYPNKNVSEERYYKDDVLNGPFKQYYPDKSVKGEGAYLNGNFNGKTAYYYPGGVCAAQGVYIGGVKTGVWMYKEKDGKIKDKEVYVNGKALNEKQEEEYFKKNPLKEPNSKTDKKPAGKK